MTFHYSTAFVALADVGEQTLKTFYTALLGQQPTIDIPAYAEFQLEGLRLGLFHPKAAHWAEFAASRGGMSLCFEVENLDVAVTHLTTLGYPPQGEIQQATHGREIYAYDPGGNRLILHESSERHGRVSSGKNDG